MAGFVETSPTTDAYWRSVILFCRTRLSWLLPQLPQPSLMRVLKGYSKKARRGVAAYFSAWGATRKAIEQTAEDFHGEGKTSTREIDQGYVHRCRENTSESRCCGFDHSLHSSCE